MRTTSTVSRASQGAGCHLERMRLGTLSLRVGATRRVRRCSRCDEADRTPTRRFGAKTTYSITRKPEKPVKQPVTVVAVGNHLELQLDGQLLRITKSDGRRLLASLLEVFE